MADIIYYYYCEVLKIQRGCDQRVKSRMFLGE